MTRQQAKRIIANLPIVQAFAEGKTVQSEDSTSLWHDCGDECYIEDAVVTRFRVKPEPREWWLAGTATVAFLNRISAEIWRNQWDPTAEVIHVREVL